MNLAAPSFRIAIVGGGVIGLSCALEFARRGVSVTLFEKNELGRGASWAAAGMLAPAFEAAGEVDAHPRLFELCTASAKLWPSWAKRLEVDSGLSAGYDGAPAIAVSTSRTDLNQLQTLARALQERRVDFQRLDASELRQIDNSLSDRVSHGLRLPTDAQVDNRATIAALVRLCEQSALIEIENRELNLSIQEGVLSSSGFDATLVCAGWQTPHLQTVINGAPSLLETAETSLACVEAYGGQMLAVGRDADSPTHTIRAGDLYIVPKADRIIIGATVEPGRVLSEPEALVIENLQQRASDICPSLGHAKVREAWAGVRPRTPSHAPMIGATSVAGLFAATGHYRNGILLAPITAKILADTIIEGRTSKLAAAFAPAGFIPEAV